MPNLGGSMWEINRHMRRARERLARRLRTNDPRLLDAAMERQWKQR